MTSLIHDLWSRIEAHESGVLLEELVMPESVPTRGKDLIALVGRARAWLRRNHIEEGDRVALIAGNSAQWVAMDLAILAEGAVSVPLYARQSLDELAWILRDCTPKAVLCADAAVGADLQKKDFFVSLLEEAFDLNPVLEPPVEVKNTALATLIYTSGTGGYPKGVMLSASNIQSVLPSIQKRLDKVMGANSRGDRVFHYLPFCFAGSRMTLWASLLRGSRMFLSMDLSKLREEMPRAQADYGLHVPMVLERIRRGVDAKMVESGAVVRWLYKAAREAWLKEDRAPLDDWILSVAQKVLFRNIIKAMGGNMRCLISGSAPLAIETQRWFEMIGLPVYQVYGLTETTAIVSMDDPSAPHMGRVGYAIEGCEIRVGPEEELWVKGPNVFGGYWNRPEDTQRSFSDGWFRTGDQVDVDAQGSLRVVGRVNEVIVLASGHNVSPAPIERALMERVAGAQHVVLFGHGRPFLVAIFSGSVQHDEVARALDHFNSQQPHYKVIRKFIVAKEVFSAENGLLTANQKIRRKIVEARYRTELDRLTARKAESLGAGVQL